MKIILTTRILDLEDQYLEISGKRVVDTKGNYIKDSSGNYAVEMVPMTLGLVISKALLGDQAGVNIDASEKEERRDLARAIRDALKGDGSIELSTEDIVKIKAQVNLNYTTVVVGPVNKLLEGKSLDVGEKSDGAN